MEETNQYSHYKESLPRQINFTFPLLKGTSQKNVGKLKQTKNKHVYCNLL